MKMQRKDEIVAGKRRWAIRLYYTNRVEQELASTGVDATRVSVVDEWSVAFK